MLLQFPFRFIRISSCTLLLVMVQLFPAKTMAQNESPLPLFDVTRSYFCPALTGDKGEATFYAIGGYQYSGYFERSAAYPNVLTGYHNRSSLNLNFSGPVYQKGKSRINLGAFSSYQNPDPLSPETDVRRDVRLSVGYSYQSNFGTFSIGINGDLIKLRTVLGIFQNGYYVSGSFYNTGAGIAFRSKNNRLYLGAAVNNLYDQTLQTIYKNKIYYYYETNKDFYLNSGFDIPIKQGLVLTPSVNIWYGYGTRVASNIMIERNKKYIFGLQYINNRGNETGGFRVGYKTGAFNFHYAYGLYLSRLATTSSSQHSIGIVYIRTPKTSK